MKRIISLVALAILAIWAQDTQAQEVTLDFTENTWGLPNDSKEKLIDAAQYTSGGYTITMEGSTGGGYYYHSTGKYVLLGKEDASLTLPAFNFDVAKIAVTGTGGASAAVKQNIFVGDEAISTETTGAKNVTNEYDIPAAYQTAGTIYKLQITSAHNTQITKIEIFKKGSNPRKPTTDVEYVLSASNYQSSPTIGEWIFQNGIAIVNNKEKTFASGLEDGIKFSRNSQFSITLPDGLSVSTITFTGYDNYGDADAYIKELNGTTYGDTDYVFPMKTVEDPENPDVLTYHMTSHTFNFSIPVTDEITFTVGGQQVVWIITLVGQLNTNDPRGEEYTTAIYAITGSNYIESPTKTEWSFKNDITVVNESDKAYGAGKENGVKFSANTQYTIKLPTDFLAQQITFTGYDNYGETDAYLGEVAGVQYDATKFVFPQKQGTDYVLTSYTIDLVPAAIGCITFTPMGKQVVFTIKLSGKRTTDGSAIDGHGISFADATVKSLCVKNWDTNGDGELSFSEAAAVTSLGTAFEFNGTITSFNELQYFIGLKSIGNSAFEGCSGLKSVTIPNSVTTIEDWAFFHCYGLTSLNIPYSVTRIGEYAFNSCGYSLKSIKVDISNPKYDSRDNCNAIIESSSNKLILGCNSTIIPNNVTCIGEHAFRGCTGLTSVTIPNSVTSIEQSAFANCTSLTSVTIPNSVTSIGNGAFSECYSLTSITIPNSVTSIGRNVFMECEKLVSVTVENPVPLKIESETFSDISANATLYVPFGSKTAYQSADYWKDFKNIVEYGDIPFADATVKSLCVKNWDTNGDGELSLSEAAAVTSLGTVFRYNDSITSFNELQYFIGLKSIGNEAFSSCISLTSVTIPNSVTSIGDYAFIWCGALTSLTIPFSVTSIGEYAFDSCGHSLKSIKVDIDNENYDSRDNCNAIIETSSNLLILGCNYTNIPNSVTSIGVHAFKGCTGLTSISIPNSVTSIRGGAFENCQNLISFTIPNSVTSIGGIVFMECGKLSSITVENPIPFAIGSDTFSEIPDNVILYVPIGSKTAYQTADYWKDFKYIVEYGDIPFVDASVKSLCINNWDTNGDGELSLNEAAAVTSLGTVFKSSKITSFNELQYFTGLTSINEGAFSSSTIKEVTLPETVTSLAKDAFLYCKSLTAIHFPSALASIGQNALSGCSAMTTITVDKANENFCDIDGVLFNKDKTTLVQFPASKSINYTVPEGTKVIGRDAFYYSQLTLVTLPESLEELGYDAFGYSKTLAEVNIPEGVTTFGPYAFDGCSALKNVYCDITAPYAIDKNNFSTKAYSNATLHVLPYLVDTYKNLEGWKYFANIKGDVIDYAVTAEATTINLGETAILPVLVANNGEIDGMQFDFTLPAGVTVATDMVGGLVVSTTDRTKKLTATCVKIADNTYRAILLSINRAIVAAGEGAVLNIQLQCADDATGGDYDIAFTNVSVSRVEGDKSVNVKVADFTAPLTVVEISKIPGDVDGNFTVDVTDVMIIVDYILNRPCSNFNFANADLDGDETINVTDAMNVVNIILHKSNARVSPTAQKIDRDLLRLGTSETGCQLHTAFDSPQITALQMEVTLPEGCRLNNVSLTGKAARSHMVKTYQLGEGTYNVVVFSIKGSILDTDTPFLQLDLEGNGGLVKIENILCTDTNHKSLTSPDLSAEVTGITVVTADDNSDTPVYNLAGQRLTKPRKGINIANGKKVVVK